MKGDCSQHWRERGQPRSARSPTAQAASDFRTWEEVVPPRWCVERLYQAGAAAVRTGILIEIPGQNMGSLPKQRTSCERTRATGSPARGSIARRIGHWCWEIKPRREPAKPGNRIGEGLRPPSLVRFRQRSSPLAELLRREFLHRENLHSKRRKEVGKGRESPMRPTRGDVYRRSKLSTTHSFRNRTLAESGDGSRLGLPVPELEVPASDALTSWLFVGRWPLDTDLGHASPCLKCGSPTMWLPTNNKLSEQLHGCDLNMTACCT